MASRAYVLWDWNGTLLDDTRAAVDTLNEMLLARQMPPIGFDFYRDHFSFPVRSFYENCGIALQNEDWDALAREYHSLYMRQERKLQSGALEALARVRALGRGQSIISALRQDLLEREAASRGIGGWMDFVCGTDNLDGSSKLSRAEELLSKLRERVSGDTVFVMIGDSLHDKEVADALGVRCVLCACGSHSGWRLERAAPTADTLEEAVSVALSL